MTHLWVRAETREHEERVGITPDGAAMLIAAGVRITVENSDQRCIPTDAFAAVGCEAAPQSSWPGAPDDAVIFGLKELPEDGTPLRHTHIMFGHAYKGQPQGRVLLDRFKAGGGTLLDLEYLTDPEGGRVAAFGYWAGFAGAAVSVLSWLAQQSGGLAGAVRTFTNAEAMVAGIANQMPPQRPRALIIGALGRVGTGAADLCSRYFVCCRVCRCRLSAREPPQAIAYDETGSQRRVQAG